MTRSGAGTAAPAPRRILIVGCGGSGKSTLARALGERGIGAVHVRGSADPDRVLDELLVRAGDGEARDPGGLGR